MSDYDSCVVRVVLEYLYGGVFNLATLSEHRQLAQLRRLARSLHLHPLRDCLNSLEITEIEEDEKSRGFFDGVDNKSAKSEEADLHHGTQNLEALSALLEDESEEVVTTTTKPEEDSGSKDADVEDDWDEFCVALTQKSRERTATTESSDEEMEGSPPGSDLFDEGTSRATTPVLPPPASPSGSEEGLLKKGSVASESGDEYNPKESLSDRYDNPFTQECNDSGSNWDMVPIF
jgi:hypothetical protein